MSLRAAFDEKLAGLKKQYASKCHLPGLRIGDKTADIAIVQGGMGVGISLSNLASAVAREGGIGVIAANAIGMTEDDYYDDPLGANVRALRRELREARRKSDGLIGVNIMVAVDCFHRLLDVAVEEKADILFLGAGLPIKGIPVRAIRESNVQVVPIVSSGRAARLIFRSWEKHYGDIPDGVVVEGPRAGGHLGFKPEQIDHPDFELEWILPEVFQALGEFEARWNRSLPVIAAGGIFTGEDIYRFLQLGAKGVQLGTRFVATHECDADVRFKQAYLACREEDIIIIQSPVGLPGRAIRGPFLKAIARGEKKLFRCPSRCLQSCEAGKARYCISEALDSARKGDLENGFAFCGANAHRVEAIVPVKQLIAGLKQGYALAGLVGALKTEVAKTSETLAALRDEYKATLAGVSGKVQAELRHLAEEHEAKYIDEKARMHERLMQIKAEYRRVKERIEELSADLGILLDVQPSLNAI
ncbi:MAG: nitronate monooxygenase [Candidatus Aminicenantes bacterium]|nr:nitronate monooxygenase [Candidatus Aminicenantes bacterium]